MFKELKNGYEILKKFNFMYSINFCIEFKKKFMTYKNSKDTSWQTHKIVKVM